MRSMSETLAIELGLARVAEAPLHRAHVARLHRTRSALALADRPDPRPDSGPRNRRAVRADAAVAAAGSRATPSHYRDGDVLGFGIMTYGLETAHLMLLAVLPRARRRNIASNLLDWLEETAITAGVSRIELEVRAGNTGARSFYRERGYHERDYLAGYYSGQESAFRMARNLRKS